MKRYVCDACHSVIDNPYNAHMKEFLVSYTYERGVGAIPVDFKQRRKIHMCGHCWEEFLKTCLRREGKIS